MEIGRERLAEVASFCTLLRKVSIRVLVNSAEAYHALLLVDTGIFV